MKLTAGLLVGCVIVFAPATMHAAAIVKATYNRDGNAIALMVYTGPGGGPDSDPAPYWALLGKAPESAYDVKIKPDEAGGKTATLNGEIEVSVKIRNKFSMGTVKTKELMLVRDHSDSNRWYIPAKELKRIQALLVENSPEGDSESEDEQLASQARIAFPKAIPWCDFSTAKLKELRSQNKPVLVFCRADWDATGKILERTLFTDKRVIDAVKHHEYIPLRADFTQHPSTEIEGFLRDVGGRPGEATIVVFHGPKHEAPIVLQMENANRFISTEDLLDAMKSESLRFVPASTYAAMSLNMRAILKKVDLDDPLIVGLRKASNVESGFLDDPKLERTVVLFPSQVEEDARPASPSGVFMQFEAAISPEVYFDRMRFSKYYEFTQEDYHGQQIHVPRLSRGIRTLREPSDVSFFPEEDVVANGTRHVVEQMIDGESSKSDGKELVNDLDPKAELHFVLQNNGKIDARMLASVFGQFDPLPGRTLGQALRDAKRVEVLFKYAKEVPVQVTIEMKDGASADRLMEQINGVLAEAPGILDALEEHEIPREEAVQPPFRELIALGRTAVKEMKVERDGTTLRMTLGHVKGLEKLPQLYIECSLILAAMSGP